MKAHFIKLFDYDFETNQKLIDTIISAPVSEKAVSLMAHLFAAKQIWLHRLSKDPLAVGFELWPKSPPESFTETNHILNEKWQFFLNQQGDFEGLINYSNLRGETFAATLTDILTHVINHGTHHRAQAGQHLKLAGVEKLPVTDYIYYTLAKNK